MFYEAFVKRELVDELKQRKIAITSALWANSNWDDKEADREGTLKTIEENFDNSVEMIYGGGPVEEDIDFKNDPFFAAAKRGMDAIDFPRSDEGEQFTAEEITKAEEDARMMLTADQV